MPPMLSVGNRLLFSLREGHTYLLGTISSELFAQAIPSLLVRMLSMPRPNPLLFVGCATVLLPPVSYDYTLAVMLIPWGWLALLCLEHARACVHSSNGSGFSRCLRLHWHRYRFCTTMHTTAFFLKARSVPSLDVAHADLDPRAVSRRYKAGHGARRELFPSAQIHSYQRSLRTAPVRVVRCGCTETT